MKKLFISLGLCLCVGFAATAQDVVVVEEVSNPAYTSNRGVSLLPEAGDFALGIEATPFLEYLGKLFTSGNSAPTFNGVDNMIYGKYFLEDNRAIRVKLRLNIYQDQHKGTVANDAEIATNPLNSLATAVDVQKINTQDVELYVGYEFRRGRGRVQGFYGGEVSLGYNGGKAIYDYGNPMTELNQNPSTTNFGSNVAVPGQRVTESRYGSQFSFGLGGFVGVEYFFAPQISVGGELGLGFKYSTRGQTENKMEAFDAASNQIQTLENRTRNANDLAQTVGLRTRTYGNIFLMFHF